MSGFNRIILHRKGAYAMFRSLRIFVDGVELGKLKNRNQLILDVPVDAFELYGAMDWSETPRFNLEGISSGDEILFRGRFTFNRSEQLGLPHLPFVISKL